MQLHWQGGKRLKQHSRIFEDNCKTLDIQTEAEDMDNHSFLYSEYFKKICSLHYARLPNIGQLNHRLNLEIFLYFNAG